MKMNLSERTDYIKQQIEAGGQGYGPVLAMYEKILREFETAFEQIEKYEKVLYEVAAGTAEPVDAYDVLEEFHAYTGKAWGEYDQHHLDE